MSTYKLFQIDAFTDKLFSGNPAAVMVLDRFFSDKVMQNIAQENNLAETAFVVPRNDSAFDLRWFTPKAEIEFCGHATIASAHVLIQELGHVDPLIFYTQIGPLKVTHSKFGYTLNAPHYASQPIPINDKLLTIFGPNIIGAYTAANNTYIELSSSAEVEQFLPNFPLITDYLLSISKPTLQGISIMAIGDGDYHEYDFISRHFAPLHGVPEDPVTGSAHAAMGPFFAKRLADGNNGKMDMNAYQCSERGGRLHISVTPQHVLITGHAITYLAGEIDLTP